MLKQRALSALIFVPLFLGIALLGGLVFDIFLGLILVFAGYEYAGMLKANGHLVSVVLLIGSILTVVLLRMFSNSAIELLVLPILMAVFGFFALWKYEHGEHQAFQSMVFQLFGVFYIGVLGAFGITLNHLETKGNLWVLVSIALVWLVDAGAYFIGTRFGKRLVLPQLSPKKTWEGFLGGGLVGLI
ncbi:MAG: phosphatidate cytidylyltransferase, partial [Anaerolineaceae bacterium]